MSCTYTVPDYNKVYTIPTNTVCGGTTKVTSYIRKDPDEKFYVGFDWVNILESGDTISTSNWTVDAGITTSSGTTSGTVTKIQIADGTTGLNYSMVNKIGTTAGDVFSITRTIVVMQK